MSGVRVSLLTAMGVLGLSAPAAQAQSAARPEPGRFEFAVGPLWVGRQTLGASDATLTTGVGGTLPLFSTSTELSSMAGIEARIGVRVTRALEAEASASYGKPHLRTAIGNDTENAASVTATDAMQQFTVGGGVLWYLPRRGASRLAPFLTGGAAYLRQLHEDATLVATGKMSQFGGGVKYLLRARDRNRLKGVGVRIDARAVLRSKGIAFDDRQHFSPAAGASLFVRF